MLDFRHLILFCSINDAHLFMYYFKLHSCDVYLIGLLKLEHEKISRHLNLTDTFAKENQHLTLCKT